VKVAVSACLLGERCRYDAQSKENLHVKEQLKGCEIVPFCPEAPVLGTPRERISVYEKQGSLRVIGDESGRDVTRDIEEQTRAFIAAHPDLDAIVLKSKSPSCGIGTTPYRNDAGAVCSYGNGVAAAMLLEHFKSMDIVDEMQNIYDIVAQKENTGAKR